MNQLSLQLGGYTIDTPTGFKEDSFNSLGGIISGLANIALLIAGFLLLIWLIWGALQYILAGGDKENLAKARSRLISAIIGFILVVIAFTFKQYVDDILQPKNDQNLQGVDEPS